MNRSDCVHRLDFDNHLALDNQICTEALFEMNLLPSDWNRLLTGHAKTALRQFAGHYSLVDRLQQAWAESGMNLESYIDDLFSNVVFGHSGISRFREKPFHAKAPRRKAPAQSARGFKF